MSIHLTELSNEQRRQLIDVRLAFAAWREAARKEKPGSLRWVTRKGTEYLYRKSQRSERSLGRRSPETEAIMKEHGQLRERRKKGQARLKSMARVNRALYLNRVPREPSLILRELDAAGLLGKHLFVIGTNALYAYEARAGVLFESGLLATNNLRLLVTGVSPDGVLGVLRKADPSYSTADDYGTLAQNADGYFVDLFCPEVDPPAERLSKKDIDPITAEGIDWLIKAPRVEETVIGSDGMPLYLPCVDPRVFALHKLWLSKVTSRQAASRPRDRAQSHAVAVVAQAFLELKFNDRALGFLPSEIKAGADELNRVAKEYERNDR